MNKDNFVWMRLSSEQLSRWKDYCEDYGLTLSGLVRDAVEEYMDSANIPKVECSDSGDELAEALLRARDEAFRLRGKSEDFRELNQRIDDLEDYQNDEIEIRIEYLEERLNTLIRIVGATNDRRLK
jgi:predicted DNA binding CopG/RHH family protein